MSLQGHWAYYRLRSHGRHGCTASLDAPRTRDNPLMFLRSSVGQHRFSAAVAQLMPERRKFPGRILELDANRSSVLALPVDTGNAISNAIPM